MVDTLTVVERLERGDFNEKQAKAMAEVLRDQVFGGALATKQDVENVRVLLHSDLNELKASVVMWFAGIMIGTTVTTLLAVFGMFKAFLP